MVNTGLFVFRDLYTDKKGKEYYIYSVKGKIRGRDFDAGMIPEDVGGYKILDMVFDTAEAIPLWYDITERTVNYNTGEKMSQVHYHAHFVDEEGNAFDCIIKPRQSSDRQILAHLFAQAGVVID